MYSSGRSLQNLNGQSFNMQKTNEISLALATRQVLPFFLSFQSSTGAPIKFYLRSVAQFGKGALIALTPAHWVNLVPSALSSYFLLLKGNTNILCKATEIFQLKNRSAANT